MPNGRPPFYHDDPLDRLLRLVVDRDMASYPAAHYLAHAQLLGKDVDAAHGRIVEEWIGDRPVYQPEPPRRVVVFFDPPEDPLWETSR